MSSQPDFAQFREDGYQLLPGLLPEGTLIRLREFFDRQLEPLAMMNKALRDTPDGKVVTNIGSLLSWGDTAPLELYALPELMNVVSAICGPDFLPVQEFSVIKHAGDDNSILWHQDMVHDRSGPAMAIGIYLDDAPANEGALRYVPGSQFSSDPICTLARQPAVEVPAKAGDVLIHDMMVAHSSEPKEQGALRRVIYLEMLSSELALKYYDKAFIERRKRLLFAARRHRRETQPSASCFKPRMKDPAPRDRKLSALHVMAEVHSVQASPVPATYCFEKIPANLSPVS